MRSLPRRNRSSRRGARAHLQRHPRIAPGARSGAARRNRSGDARRVDLRPRTNRGQRDRIGSDPSTALRSRKRTMKTTELTIDGRPARVREGATLLEACTSLGIDTPTLCFLETLTPVNACRVCVVELEGSRALVPACARRAEPGMAIHTDSPRVRHSRKMVLEFLASSVDLSTAPDAQRYCERYGADPSRYGEARATVAAAAQDRQRTLRARLCQVHSLLQMRRSLRHRRAKHVRDRRRGTRVRGRASPPSTTSRYPIRPASTAATASASARPAR